jgi:hypothetical protein
MNKFFLIVVTCFNCVLITAQAKKTFSVNPGQKIVDAIPVTELYTFPEFTIGNVTLKDNTVATVKLNYNHVFGEMQFIDPKTGDTISLADEKNIKFVAVEKDTFYFDEGWLKQMDHISTLTIAKRKLLQMSNKEKLGAMDSPSFGAIETYTKYTGSQHMRDLVAKERLTFSEHVTYYFGDRFKHFSRANKKGLIKMFNKDEKQLETWLDDNKIDFNNEDDLKKLATFLQSL